MSREAHINKLLKKLAKIKELDTNDNNPVKFTCTFIIEKYTIGRVWEVRTCSIDIFSIDHFILGAWLMQYYNLGAS